MYVDTFIAFYADFVEKSALRLRKVILYLHQKGNILGLLQDKLLRRIQFINNTNSVNEKL